MSHEDGSSHVQRLRAADAHDPAHEPRHAADDHLHHAQVIQQRKKSRDEDDGRQYLKGKEKTEMRVVRAQVAEDKAGPRERISKKLFDLFSGGAHHCLAPGVADHDPGKHELQAQSPEDRLQTNGAAVGGEQICDRQKHDDAQQTRES